MTYEETPYIETARGSTFAARSPWGLEGGWKGPRGKVYDIDSLFIKRILGISHL